MQNLKINSERLWGEIMETGKIGGTPKGGVCRLTLSETDRQVRDWFRARAEAFGCVVTVDDMGAMFARRRGSRDIPPIAMGSHLDTQPTGGKFDGVLGVLAALEALRTLHEAGYETFAPIEVVNWTNEEGSRFSPGMAASGVFAGVFKRDWILARKDKDGVSFGEALNAINYCGPEKSGAHPLSAYFELHIEQGPILEAEGKEIGIVTAMQGLKWFEVTLTGQDAHTGATPMNMRKNALLGAARLIERADAIAHAHAPLAVGTVGMIEVRPNSRNVVPGEVFFTVDMRHPDGAVLQAMEHDLNAAVKQVSSALNLGASMAIVLDQAPVPFHPDCIAAVRHGASVSGYSTREIVSGAGHDAGYVAQALPATMIFIPCLDGISHNEAEFSSQQQCAAGAQVLLQAVLEYDRRLGEKQRNI